MNNPWFKLATVSFAGLLISFALLWGIQQFNSYQYYNGYSQYGMMNTGMTGNVNASAGMNMQNGSMSAGMTTSGNMSSGMSGNMSSGMGMGMNSNMNSSSGSSMQSSGSSSGSMGMMSMMDGM